MQHNYFLYDQFFQGGVFVFCTCGKENRIFVLRLRMYTISNTVIIVNDKTYNCNNIIYMF